MSSFVMNNDLYKKFVKYNETYLDSFIRYKDKPNFMNPDFASILFKTFKAIDGFENKERTKSINIFNVDDEKRFLKFYNSIKKHMLFLAMNKKENRYDCFVDSHLDFTRKDFVSINPKKMAIIFENKDCIKSLNMSLCPQGFFIYQDLVNTNSQETSSTPNKVNFGNLMKIEIADDFWVSETKITQEIWQEVMGYNPSHFNGVKESLTLTYFDENDNPIDELTYKKPNDFGIDLQRPVDSITWYDAIEFCNRLSLLNGLTPCYIIETKPKYVNYPYVHWDVKANGFRLLTDVEWDYVSKAISSSIEIEEKDVEMYWTKERYQQKTKEGLSHSLKKPNDIRKRLINELDNENPKLALIDANDRMMLDKGLSNFDSFIYGITPKVALNKPNAFGLYDMYGLVDEFVFDTCFVDYSTSNGEICSKYEALKKKYGSKFDNVDALTNFEAYIQQGDCNMDSIQADIFVKGSKSIEFQNIQDSNGLYLLNSDYTDGK